MKKFICFLFFIHFITIIKIYPEVNDPLEIYEGIIGNVPYKAYVYGDVYDGEITSAFFVSQSEKNKIFTPSLFILSKNADKIIYKKNGNF